MTQAPAAYSVDQFRDPSAELARLAQQSAIIASAEEEALRALGFPPQGRVLDVGCGPGFFAARVRKTWPDASIIGVDRDAAVAAQARATMEVAEGRAEELPFPSAHFDCVYARLVLRHLSHPEVALREMHRVLRPGGRAIVIDTDDGALVLHPQPPAFMRALVARQETFRRRGADPFIGRRLPSLFAGAGFIDTAFHPLVLDSVSVGPAPFARIVLAPVADAIDCDLLDGAGVAAAAAAIESWAGDPAAFGMTTVVAYGGGKR